MIFNWVSDMDVTKDNFFFPLLLLPFPSSSFSTFFLLFYFFLFSLLQSWIGVLEKYVWVGNFRLPFAFFWPLPFGAFACDCFDDSVCFLAGDGVDVVCQGHMVAERECRQNLVRRPGFESDVLKTDKSVIQVIYQWFVVIWKRQIKFDQISKWF